MKAVGETKSDQLYNLLEKYCNNVSGVLGVGISTVDGLEISSRFNGVVNPEMAHAVSSSLFNLSQVSAKKLGLNGFKLNLTYTDNGIIALQKVNNNSLVLIILEPGSNVDLAMVEMEDFINEIKRLL